MHGCTRTHACFCWPDRLPPLCLLCNREADFLLSIILVECYSANLAAFLTVTQLQANVQTLDDLRGKAVGTSAIYTARLARRGLATTVYDAEAALVSLAAVAAVPPGPRRGMVQRMVDPARRAPCAGRGGRQQHDVDR